MLKTYSRIRVDWTSIDVKIIFRENFGSFIDGPARSIEDTPQHIFRNAYFQVVACELDFGLVIVSAQLE